MIDCHCHLLPGLDDGAKNLDYAMQMAKVAVAAGITDVIATPHHLNGVYLNSHAVITAAVAEFNSALVDAGIRLTVHPGSEIHLVPEIVEAIENGSAMTYADKSKAVLVELPKHTVPVGSEQILETLIYLGIVPVLAHPERNSRLRQEPGRLEEWVAMGCKVQLTTNSCDGSFGSEIQKLCKHWCRQGLVHLVASDAHRVKGRAPSLVAGRAMVEKWLTPESTAVIFDANPRSLLRGEKLAAAPATNRAAGRKWMRIFG